MIRGVEKVDAHKICEIYNHYVLTTSISFETDAVSVDDMVRRIDEIKAGGYPYHVYLIDEEVVGYCYFNKWNGRCAYQTTVEISIYVDKNFVGRGVGASLIKYAIDGLDRRKFHTIVAGITIPNVASIVLHEAYGFKQISHFKEVGFKFNQWQDVGHWQLIL